MEVIKKIENIFSFSVVVRNVFLCEDKTKVVYLDGNLSIIFSKDTNHDLQEVRSTNGMCWINTSNNGTSFLLDKYQLSKKQYLIKYISKNNYIYCRLNNKGIKIDINNNIEWEIERNFFEFIVSNKYFFYRVSKDVVSNINDKYGFEIWTFSLPENKYNWYTKSNYENAPDEFHRGEIFRIIGEYSGVFWIALNSGVLLGLNSETGELCYELIHPNNYNQTGQPFNLAINTQLDRGRGILFGLRNKYYWEVDLQNPATNYSLYNITESCNKWNISADMPVREWSWAGDKIYFGEIFDSPYNQKLNNVGIFDRANREVIHAMRIGEGGKHDVLPNIQKIQFESGRLYVLDGRKVLHILE